jgi:hypothetical protein
MEIEEKKFLFDIVAAGKDVRAFTGKLSLAPA